MTINISSQLFGQEKQECYPNQQDWVQVLASDPPPSLGTSHLEFPHFSSSSKDCKCRDHRKTWETRILKALNEAAFNYLHSPLSRNWLEDEERNHSRIFLDDAKM